LHIPLYLIVLILCLLLCACGDSSPGSPATPSSDSSSGSGSEESGGPGTRDNTPQVLVPSADGIDVYSCDVATIDASNSSEGYVMVSYTGSNAKVKLQITCPDSVTYTYNLHSGYEVFPLTAGNGSYSLSIYESVDIEASKYATAFSQTIDVSLDNEFGPFLYPNQYVDFTKDSLPVAKAEELAYSADTDLDVVANVYNYMIENFTYDYDKADSVQSGYLPVVDDVFKAKTGICFDYASVTATMLRSQGIPTRLEVGYKGEQYHAWISTYIEDKGWINGIIEFDGTTWHLLDPTFASTSSSPEKFIMEEDDYITKFVY
jgi:transglutaminase-like putative cysteine protease